MLVLVLVLVLLLVPLPLPGVDVVRVQRHGGDVEPGEQGLEGRGGRAQPAGVVAVAGGGRGGGGGGAAGGLLAHGGQGEELVVVVGVGMGVTVARGGVGLVGGERRGAVSGGGGEGGAARGDADGAGGDGGGALFVWVGWLVDSLIEEGVSDDLCLAEWMGV